MFLLLFIYAILIFLSCTQAERDNFNDPGSVYFYCDDCYSSSDKISSSSSIDDSSSSSIDDNSSPIEEISSSSEFIYGSLQDSRDGKTYKTIAIGEQTWMAENLNYFAVGSICYNNTDSNCEKYGRLYDWNTAIDICPEGWFLPGDKEWDSLIVYTNPDAGKKLKAIDEWQNNNGTDDYGFAALPGGKSNSKNKFDNMNYNGYWWSAELANYYYSYYRYMSYNNNSFSREYNSKTNMFSVRCIEGISNYRYYCGEVEYTPSKELCYDNVVYLICNEELYDTEYCLDVQNNYKGVFLDSRNGKKYKYVVIGEQIWMAENLNYKTYSAKCYDDKPENCIIYGTLHNWESAKTVCPKDWHLPNDSEWNTLSSFVGSSEAGTKLKANSDLWISGKGTDDFDFNALPGGFYRDIFKEIGELSGFWSSTEGSWSSSAHFRFFKYNITTLNLDGFYINNSLANVRCIKD